MHKHHIIPRYEGGSDSAENLVELTVTQHAMWHFAEWQRKKRIEDRLAWQGLAGIIPREEAVRKASLIGSYKWGKARAKPVSLLNIETGEKASFESCTEACAQLGLTPGLLSLVISGYRAHTRGWIPASEVK